MDMQNVSNLVIPEGNVRTIHDKDNKLIWGSVGYDIKYSGDSSQDGTPTPDSPVNINVVTGSQTITVTGKNIIKFDDIPLLTNQTVNYYRQHSPQINTTLVAGEIYTFSADVTIGGSVSGARLTLGCGGNAFAKDIASTPANISSGKASITFTPTQTQLEYGTHFYLRWPYIVGTTTGVDYSLRDAMLEVNSSDTVYEPYQGHSYTVNLGSTELCKLGNYQDYIYKSGNDWYVHKAIGKTVLDGSEAWFKSGTSAIDRFGVPNTYFDGVTSMSSSTTISDHFVYNSGAIYGTYHISGTNVYFDYTPNGTTTKDQWVSWLSSNHTTVYYVVGTPTDTKITDATLTAQLDAVHQFLTRYGYNGTVSGNLPIIIDRTNL